MEPVDLLIRDAAEVVTCRGAPNGVRGPALSRLEVIADGAVAVRAGRIVAVGESARLLARFQAKETIDATGRLVSPGLIDPHTHLVHAGSRHEEWEARVLGRPPGLAGGIRWTVEQTSEAGDAVLTRKAMAYLDTMLAHGTTTVEAKSGYGLEPERELRLLRLIRGLRHPMDVVVTYLAAHVLPTKDAADRAAYVARAIETVPEAARLAEYCDVFCDPAGFTAGECRAILEAALGSGMRLRPVSMDFNYGTSFGERSPSAYETLLVDAMVGDPTLYTRQDMVEASWRVIQPIQENPISSMVSSSPFVSQI